MKLATFNINNVNRRLPNLLEWLARESPDVVCLQELKATDKQFPVREIRDAGYHAIYRGEPLWNGVAILSKTQPIETRRALPGHDTDPHARYIEAAVDGILIGCIYLPNGNPLRSAKFTYKLAWFESLIAHAQSLHDSGHPVALVGDYNVVPTDVDIYDPKSWKRNALLQPEARERYRRLLSQGWLDSLRTTHEGERIYTFWDYFRNHWERNAGLRIDHLLLSPSLAPRLRAAGVDTWTRGQPGASDHAPTWVKLGEPRKAATTKAKREPATRRKSRV
jgi:exodeoxyribonuclease-3